MLRAPIGAAVEDESAGAGAGESSLVGAGGSSDGTRTGPVSAVKLKDHVEWSGQVDRPYSFFSSPALSSSSRSRYAASSGKKKSSGNNSSSRRPPPIPPACCEWTHCAAAASTDAKSPSISTVREVARSRNASGSTSRFVSTTCVVCPRFPLFVLAHSRRGIAVRVLFGVGHDHGAENPHLGRVVPSTRAVARHVLRLCVLRCLAAA